MAQIDMLRLQEELAAKTNAELCDIIIRLLEKLNRYEQHIAFLLKEMP